MKLSIITINLNDKVGLQKTIDSVSRQTFSDYEYLVIDGDSNDGSKELIKGNEDKITYWVSEPDSGIYNAMNKGIKAAKGEYLYFLNAGDWLYSDDVLEQMFKDTPNTPFICGNFYKETNGDIKLFTPFENKACFTLHNIYADFLCHQAFFIRKDNFDKYGLYNEDLKIMSDWELFLVAIGVNDEEVTHKNVNLVVYNAEGLSSVIGGQFMYEEKRKVASKRLDTKTAEILDRMYYLEQQSYIIDAVTSSKVLSIIVRGWCKVKRILNK